MPEFRKKPVVISAEQFTLPPEVVEEIKTAQAAANISPFISTQKFLSFPVQLDEAGIFIEIKTLESNVFRASLGDWIITGVKGEIYSCKPDIFMATYDALPETGPAVESVLPPATGPQAVYLPGLGSVVAYQSREGVWRPGIVVRVCPDEWGYPPGSVQLQVFCDGNNDRMNGFSADESARGMAWRTSVHRGDGAEQWLWPFEVKKGGHSS